MFCLIDRQTTAKSSNAWSISKMFCSFPHFLPFPWVHYANLCKVAFITWYVVGLFTLKLLTGEWNALCCIFNLYSNIHLAVFHPVKLIPWKYHETAVRYKTAEVLSVGQSSNVPGICTGALSLPRNGQRIPLGFLFVILNWKLSWW